MKKGMTVIFAVLTIFIFSCSDVSVSSSMKESNDSDTSDNVDVPGKDDKNDPAPECVSSLDCRVNFICVSGVCVESDGSGSDMGNSPQDFCRKLCEQEILCYPEELDPGEEKEAMADCMRGCPEEIEESLKEAYEISSKCGAALTNLIKCIVNLNCDDVEDYWDGEPFEDSYPCDSNEEHMIEEC